jgi:hypothetical protein
MRFVFSSEAALNAQLAAATQQPTVNIPDASEPVLEWLGRLRMLIGVPFEYLVPDDGLLRPETIRFFYVDRNWTDAAVDGAVAAGAYGTRDRVTLQQRHAAVREAVDEAERHQRVGGESVTETSSETANLAGFLLRSRAVSGWPGLHVRGFRGTRRLVIMRMERLAPAVLLVIFDDIPDRMEIEEPRQGIQFGVRAARDAEPAGSWWVDVRDPATGVEAAGSPKERVPFRAGSAGVLHLTELRRRLTTNHGLIVGPTLTSAELALQLLRYPYQQRFGAAPGGTLGDVLKPRYTIDDMRGWLVVQHDG